jgi:hypothetical protein
MSDMRKILSLAAVLALAACGGGGGSSTPTSPPPPVQTTAPTGNYVTPQFRIVIPNGKTSGAARKPNYVSSATLSVQITLTADSIGVTPNTIANNPATTTIASGTCNTGCTVNGPPSPPGTDSFLIVTYDNNVPASGHPLNAAQLNNVGITAGQNNPESITLGAIPKTLSISNVPSGAGAFAAGTQTQSTAISVVATDAAGVTIPTSQSPAVTYVDATGTAINVTVSDPDTNAHGSCVVPTGTSTCTSGAGTSVTFAYPDTTNVLAYDGLAENPVTLTASASTATSGTTSFQPKLNAPAFNGTPATPSGVALPGSAEIDLFALSGIGSTGTEYFTESGWTSSPYNHALLVTASPTCTSGGPLSTFATVAAGTNSTTNGTPFTATESGATPVAGSCPQTIGDGLSLNTTDGSATLTVTYTTSGITASSKHRK